MSWTPPIGAVRVERDSYEAMVATVAATEKQRSSTCSNTSEKDRAEKKLRAFIQKRIRHQNQITQLSKDIGILLRTLRSNSNLTISGVARQVGMNFEYLHDIEHGVREVNLSTLYAILKLYGVDITHELAHAKANY